MMMGAVSTITLREEEAVAREGGISAIQHGEEEAVARFYAGFEREARALEFWQERLHLWWRDNPAFGKDWPLGVKMTEGGRIVGVISAIPTRILSEGTETIAAALTTWRVERSHRSGSIGMFEAVLAQHATRVIIDGTPTPAVVHLLKRFGFERPREQFAATRFVCSWWRMFGRGVGARPVVLTSSRIFLDGRLMGAGEVDALVDDLWARTRSQFEMLAVRDSTYLRWFCREGRSPGRFAVVVTDGAGNATAFATALDMGGGVAWLVDFWGDFSQPGAAASVIDRSRWHARRLGFHSLWVPHFHPVVAGACGPLRHRHIPASAFIKPPHDCDGGQLSYWPVATGDFAV